MHPPTALVPTPTPSLQLRPDAVAALVQSFPRVDPDVLRRLLSDLAVAGNERTFRDVVGDFFVAVAAPSQAANAAAAAAATATATAVTATSAPGGGGDILAGGRAARRAAARAARLRSAGFEDENGAGGAIAELSDAEAGPSKHWDRDLESDVVLDGVEALFGRR